MTLVVVKNLLQDRFSLLITQIRVSPLVKKCECLRYVLLHYCSDQLAVESLFSPTELQPQTETSCTEQSDEAHQQYGKFDAAFVHGLLFAIMRPNSPSHAGVIDLLTSIANGRDR